MKRNTKHLSSIYRPGVPVRIAKPTPCGYNGPTHQKEPTQMRPIEKIKTITMRGRRYRFIVKKLSKVRGMTDHPATKGKAVHIDSREEGKQLLATVLDELIHCAVWELENEIVDEISDDMAEVLWRCGLRFTETEDLK